MDFTKYQDKLTNEEMHFFEKIFEDKEVQENLQILKKERIKFLIKIISLWLFIIWFFSSIFILDKTTWIMSLIILLYIVIWFYYIKKVKFFSNFDENFSKDIIRYKIFENFFAKNNSETFVAEPEKDEYFILFWKDNEKQIEVSEKIRIWMIESGRLKDTKKVFPAEIITKI